MVRLLLQDGSESGLNANSTLHPFSTYHVAISNSQQLKRSLREAWQIALSEGGTVHLDLPTDIQTADIDFLITADDFKKIVNLLKKEGYKEDYSQEVFTRLTTDSDYLVDLDFMFVDDKTLSKVIDEGSEIEIAKQKFIVPSLNHLIALKLHSIKNNPKLRKEKDLPDIIELIKANKVDIKNNDFKNICLTYGTQDLYEEILRRI